MRRVFCFAAACATSLSLFGAGYVPFPPELRWASSHGADTKIQLCVVDDVGRPVQGAKGSVFFYLNQSFERFSEDMELSGLTDGNGAYVARGKSVGEIYYGVTKTNYYKTMGKIWLQGTPAKWGEVKRGKWQPYGARYEVILKPIKHPIPMVVSPGFAARYESSTNEFIGFDLKAYDWVKPRGKGEVADFEVSYVPAPEIDNRYAGATLTLRFVRPFDGAYIRDAYTLSEFRSCYHADTNAVFESKLVFSTSYNPSTAEWKRHKLTDKQYLVVRTRCKVDEKGNLIGAHYSKIYGEMSFGYSQPPEGSWGIRFISYFNPTFNDTNLESDPRKAIPNAKHEEETCTHP